MIGSMIVINLRIVAGPNESRKALRRCVLSKDTTTRKVRCSSSVIRSTYFDGIRLRYVKSFDCMLGMGSGVEYTGSWRGRVDLSADDRKNELGQAYATQTHRHTRAMANRSCRQEERK